MNHPALPADTSVHPLGGEEVRALRRLRREQPERRHLFQTERDAPMTPAGFSTAASFFSQIERKLAEDGARPIIFYARAGTCWQPYVKGFTIMVNSIYNGWRMEDAWLDK